METALIFDYNQYQAFPDYQENEKAYVQYLAGTLSQQSKAVNAAGSGFNLSKEIQKAREQIKSSLNDASGASSSDMSRIEKLEKSNAELLKMVTSLLERVSLLEDPNKSSQKSATSNKAPVSNGKTSASDDDAGEDLFASSDEDEKENEKVKADRIAAYQQRKAKKPALIAKSQIILDVKPWDDETDMKMMEELVRGVKTDGLLWGTSKLIPLAYGIKKLQICCVVEDDKVGTDYLEEEITKYEDYVQSVDIAAFSKI